MMRMIIQEEPPQPLLHPQPIAVPPFAFLNHPMKSRKKCYKKENIFLNGAVKKRSVVNPNIPF